MHTVNRQHIPLLPRWKVARGAVHRRDRRVGKCLGVEARGVFRVPVVLKANCVLRWLFHVRSPFRPHEISPEDTVALWLQPGSKKKAKDAFKASAELLVEDDYELARNYLR